VNNVVALQLETSWQQNVYDNAPKGYATIVPSVKVSADKSAYATVGASISTDTGSVCKLCRHWCCKRVLNEITKKSRHSADCGFSLPSAGFCSLLFVEGNVHHGVV